MGLSRDLLLLIDHVRNQMPRRLIGVGHSFGGNVMSARYRLPVSENWTDRMEYLSRLLQLMPSSTSFAGADLFSSLAKHPFKFQ